MNIWRDQRRLKRAALVLAAGYIIYALLPIRFGTTGAREPVDYEYVIDLEVSMGAIPGGVQTCFQASCYELDLELYKQIHELIGPGKEEKDGLNLVVISNRDFQKANKLIQKSTTATMLSSPRITVLMDKPQSIAIQLSPPKFGKTYWNETTRQFEGNPYPLLLAASPIEGYDGPDYHIRGKVFELYSPFKISNEDDPFTKHSWNMSYESAGLSFDGRVKIEDGESCVWLYRVPDRTVGYAKGVVLFLTRVIVVPVEREVRIFPDDGE